MKNKFLIVFLFIACFLSSCNSDLGNSFKIMNDLRSEYDFNSVEMSWSNLSAKFTLQDIDHDDLTIENLQSYSLKVDNYLKSKYPKIDSLNIRTYLFSGAGGFEIVEFTLDKKGNLIKTKKY